MAQPVLERIPQGALIGRDRLAPDWTQAVVLCTDQMWRSATIVAWCKFRRGWAVLGRWPDGREDWRQYHPERLRRSAEQLDG